MINKDFVIEFLSKYFSQKRIEMEHFDSGCSMVDVYISEIELLCIQIEPERIGVSIVQNYSNSIDLSNLPDNIFYSNGSFEDFIRKGLTK